MAGNGLVAVRSNVTSSVQRMTGPQRVTLGFAFVATVIGLFVVSQITGDVPMRTLYADLDPAAAAAVVEQLEADGTPYELTGGGTTIQVPADEVHALRLDLSAQGLPSSGEGWSVLENQGITTSEFDQRVGYQRAMEGELAATISAIDGIADANVHLVIPEDDLFVGDDVMASASVLIMSEGNAEVTPTQVEAIVNLVASSVEGMTPERVSVTDQAGRILAAPGEGSSVIGLEGDSQLRATASFEREMENDLESLLAAVVGPGMAMVNVTAELDFDTVSSVTEEYVPLEDADGEQRMLSETTRDEVYRDATGEQATGVLGTEVPTIDGEGNEVDPEDTAGDAENAEGTDAETGIEYELSERDALYAMNKTVTTADNSVGEVTALSVAVLLNEDLVDAARLPEIETLVQAAVGLDEARGDEVVVSLLPIDEQVAEAIEAANTPLEEAEGGGLDLVGLLRTIGTVIVALLIVVLGLRSLRQGPKRTVIDSVELAELTSGTPELEAATAEAEAEAAALAAAEQTEETENQLQSLIANQPDEVAGVLRSWLNEEEELAR